MEDALHSVWRIVLFGNLFDYSLVEIKLNMNSIKKFLYDLTVDGVVDFKMATYRLLSDDDLFFTEWLARQDTELVIEWGTMSYPEGRPVEHSAKFKDTELDTRKMVFGNYVFRLIYK